MNAITHIEFTIADHIANGFANIGTIRFDDPGKGEAFWNELPEDDTQNPKVDDFNLLADLYQGDGNCVDDRLVTRETIERHMGQSIEAYIENRKQLVDEANGGHAPTSVSQKDSTSCPD